MANTYSTLTALFTAIANAIRAKTGGSASIKADDFPSAIGDIPTGTDVSDTTAVAADVLSGKDFYLANGTKASGSIPSQAAQTITPTTVDQTIPAGKYLSGAQTVKGDANLVSANIAAGVSIFGVQGSHQGGGGDADLDDFVQGTLQALVTDATSVRGYAVYNNMTLQSVSAAEATSVGQYAFQGCSNLASASFAKATSIGYYAFYSLSNLASVSIPLAVTLAGYCFYQCAKLLFPNNELLAKTVQDYALYNAARSTNGFAWKPNASGASASQYAFAGAKVIEVDGDNVTSIGNYAFQNAEWLADADFASAVITSLGQYAFQNAGKSRADLTTALLLDFHSGTFTQVQQYTFAGLKNTVVTLPATVTQLNANAFNGIEDSIVFITRTASVPTLSATTVFASASNSFVALPYDNLYAALQNANWNAISSMVVGFAPAGTFVAGAALPATDSGSHDIYWSTDPAGEGWVTECPSGSPILYAHLGSKTGWWIDVDVTGATVTVTADGVTYAITDGRATVPQTAQSIDIVVTYPSGYDTSITLNGVAVTQFPITGLPAGDYVLSGQAYDPSGVGVDWATDSWQIIKNTSVVGQTAEIYGSQVGATRQITLTDNTTMTIRLSNADDTMYTLSDGSRTSGLCMEFVDCFSTTAPMNSSRTNFGGWNASIMRTVTMASLYDLLPSDLKSAIATVDIKASAGGPSNDVTTSADNLFLLAAKEVFGTSSNGRSEENAVLTQWKWYQDHDTETSRRKNVNNGLSTWWLRSPAQDSYDRRFIDVYLLGSQETNDANTTQGVSPAFVI